MQYKGGEANERRTIEPAYWYFGRPATLVFPYLRWRRTFSRLSDPVARLRPIRNSFSLPHFRHWSASLSSRMVHFSVSLRRRCFPAVPDFLVSPASSATPCPPLYLLCSRTRFCFGPVI